MRMLIIDDEASVRSITSQTLEAFGYRVVTAADGAEGLEWYRPQPDTAPSRWGTLIGGA